MKTKEGEWHISEAMIWKMSELSLLMTSCLKHSVYCEGQRLNKEKQQGCMRGLQAMIVCVPMIGVRDKESGILIVNTP